MTERINCIACAEPIQAKALLCKHCGTMQDDPRFVHEILTPTNTLTSDEIRLAIQTGEAVTIAKLSQLHPADDHQWECATCTNYAEEFGEFVPATICALPMATEDMQREVWEQSLSQNDAELTNTILEAIVSNLSTSENLLFEICRDAAPYILFDEILDHPNCSRRIEILIESES